MSARGVGVVVEPLCGQVDWMLLLPNLGINAVALVSCPHSFYILYFQAVTALYSGIVLSIKYCGFSEATSGSAC